MRSRVRLNRGLIHTGSSTLFQHSFSGFRINLQFATFNLQLGDATTTTDGNLIITVLILLICPQHSPAEPHWEILNPRPVAGDVVSVDFPGEDTGYLITDCGRMMRTTDGGESWSVMGLPYVSSGPWAVDFRTPESGWVLGGMDIEEPWRQVIYHTSDGGANWETWYLGNQFEPSFINSLQFLDADHGWAGGGAAIQAVTRPVVFRYLGGDGWVRAVLPEGDGVCLYDVFFSSRNHGWAVGQNGYIARSINGGETWERVDGGTELDLYSAYFIDPFTGWVAGGNFRTALVLRTTDGGENWQSPDESPAANRICAVRALDEERAVAISLGDQVPARIIYTADGQQWETVFEEGHLALFSLTPDGPLRVGGSQGFISASADGRNWQQLSSSLISGNASDIQFLNNLEGWCGGEGGIVLTTADGGSNWRGLETGLVSTLFAVCFRDRNTGWVAGQNSRELFTGDAGRSWQEVDIAAGDVSCITFSGDTGYAVHGRSVAVSLDGGETWRSRQIVADDQDGIVAISVPEPAVAYAASPTDSLRRTLDAGETWEALATPFIGCLGVSFPDTDYGWVVGVSPGEWHRVFYTEDGGRIWRSSLPVDFIALGIEFIDREHGWIRGLDGELLFSDDGGRNWRDMELRVARSLQGLAAAAPDRVWICGDGGLIARWGDEWEAAPYSDSQIPRAITLLSAFPNPTNGLVSLTLTVHRPGYYELGLFDMEGRFIRLMPQSYTSPGRYNVSLSLEGMPAGVYLAGFGKEGLNNVSKIVLVK